MDKSLYVGMSGAKQILDAMTVHSNNLSNTSSIGFKEDFVHFETLPVHGDCYPTRAYPIAQQKGFHLEAGMIIPTGRDLDVAIQGEGWFCVQNKEEKKEAYTRDGHFSINDQRFLTSAHGSFVKGESGLIQIPPFDAISISSDGVISIIPPGGKNEDTIEVARLSLVKVPVAEISKGVDGLFYSQNENTYPPSEDIQVISQNLESSNVNAIGNLTKLLSLSRMFELNIKLMHSVEENEKASNHTLSI